MVLSKREEFELTMAQPSSLARSDSLLIRYCKSRLVNVILILLLIFSAIFFLRGSSWVENGPQEDAEEPVRRPGAQTGKQAPKKVVVEIVQAKIISGEEDLTTTALSEEETTTIELEETTTIELEETTTKMANDKDRRNGKRRNKKAETTTFQQGSTTAYETTTMAMIFIGQDHQKKPVRRADLDLQRFEVAKLFPLDLLSNYRNPCFFEEREEVKVIVRGQSPYESNPYSNVPEVADLLESQKKVVIRSHEELCNDADGCRLRCLSYFMLIGLAESETTEVFHLLSQHPQVEHPVVDKPAFWDRYRFSGMTLNDYFDLFDNATAKVHNALEGNGDTNKNALHPNVIGEVEAVRVALDPYWPEDSRNSKLPEPKSQIADDVHAVMPRLKTIFLTRNPGQHLHWLYWNNPNTPKSAKSADDFHKKSAESIKWWKTCTGTLQLPVRHCMYGTPSEMPVLDSRGTGWWPTSSNYTAGFRDVLYSIYISDWTRRFNKEQVLVVNMDDFYNSKGLAINKIFSFLGLSQFSPRIEVSQNAGAPPYQPLRNDTSALLDEFFKPFNDQLSSLLNGSFLNWSGSQKTPYPPDRKCCGY